MTKTIAVLGSTGSVGTQTLEVAEHLGLRVASLTANKSAGLLEAQIRKFRPDVAAVADESAADELRSRVRDIDVRVVSGVSGVCEAAAVPCDTVVNALSGASGEEPTFAAISAGRNIALANKETLVRAGNRVMSAARSHGVAIIPVDSEHSAIFQCLRGQAENKIKRVILTASGGAFRGRTPDEIRGVTPEQALRHPNWRMGAKITVDSATLMNKGLEYIEAMRLFGLAPGQIAVVVHPQSIIHSAVEFVDGAIIAQLGAPDMRVPIQYALTYPSRAESLAPPLDLARIGALTFEEPDWDTFPCLALAIRAAPLGDRVCAVLSDANELAVARFLSGEIGFLDIYEFVRGELQKITDVRA